MVNTWWVNHTDDDFEDIWAREYASDGRHVAARERVKKAQTNDLVFHKFDRRIVAISRVVEPSFDQLRGDANGYKLLIDCTVLDRPFPIDRLDPNTIPTGKGTPFKPGTNHAYQGYFFPVAEELAQILFQHLGVDDIDLNANTKTGTKITLAGRTDADVISTIRREQPQLRALLLKGRDEAPCTLCNRTLPSRYLIASHIKRRADCTEEERRDPHVAMLTCLLGCDAAFELGDVFVDNTGALRVHDAAPKAIHDLFTAQEGHAVSVFGPATAPYFTHRRGLVSSPAANLMS